MAHDTMYSYSRQIFIQNVHMIFFFLVNVFISINILYDCFSLFFLRFIFFFYSFWFGFVEGRIWYLCVMWICGNFYITIFTLPMISFFFSIHSHILFSDNLANAGRGVRERTHKRKRAWEEKYVNLFVSRVQE